MTTRQKILKAVYPIFLWFTKKTGKNTSAMINERTTAPVPFYNLSGTLNNGAAIDLPAYKGRKLLLVNTASDCGYTNQYEGLEKLYRQFKDSLIVIGFPANDFKEQEKGSDEAIAEFCKVNYGVTFPLMKKGSVVKGTDQNEIFQWLTDPAKNGWNSQEPTWNFCKYIIDEEGNLTHFFEASVEPLSDTVINAIKK